MKAGDSCFSEKANSEERNHTTGKKGHSKVVYLVRKIDLSKVGSLILVLLKRTVVQRLEIFILKIKGTFQIILTVTSFFLILFVDSQFLL